MPGKPNKPFIKGGIRWLIAEDKTELTCELIENSKLILLKGQTYAFDVKGKTIDGAFKIEYDPVLLSKVHTVNLSNGGGITIKKHRITPLILITGMTEDYIEEGRDLKTLFKLTYDWDPDSSDYGDEEGEEVEDNENE